MKERMRFCDRCGEVFRTIFRNSKTCKKCHISRASYITKERISNVRKIEAKQLKNLKSWLDKEMIKEVESENI